VDEKTLRVSDADRDAAIAELGEHFRAGRLDLADLEDRTGRGLRARVGSDLDELLADLPRTPRAPGRPQAAARARQVLIPFLVPVLVAVALTAAVLIAAVLIASVSAAAVLIAAVSAAAGTTGAHSGGPCGR